MYKSILISDHQSVRNECTQIITNLKGIESINLSHPDELKLIGNDFNYLFILITDFKSISLKQIKDNFPATAIILYNHSLFLGQIKGIEDLSDIHVIIGENRLKNLTRTLAQIKESHWRKLPLERLGIDWAALSSRMQESIRYVEENKLDVCTLDKIANHIGISSGYFSQEFKRETGYSFRAFIQRVLIYYEDEVFVKLNLSAMNMAKLLGYSELSSFSRSFKKRRGISPTHYRKKIN